MSLALTSEKRHPAEFYRHDPQREAQELLQAQRTRPLVPPGVAPLASPKEADDNHYGTSRGPTPNKSAASAMGRTPVPHSGGGPRRRRVLSARGAGEGSRSRIKRSEQNWLMAMARDDALLGPAPDHRRRCVLLHELRDSQDRWPVEARWAGNPPDFIRPRFDRLGTLRNERGDGRSLPSERGEVWWWS
mmetsp:Transcript_22520/g.49348  ORF Transcript_22520/g.49348 Transcript_22520/m.49348 type:complete len:189 (+) Transcript_22520:57-623(+)